MPLFAVCGHVLPLGVGGGGVGAEGLGQRGGGHVVKPGVNHGPLLGSRCAGSSGSFCHLRRCGCCVAPGTVGAVTDPEAS